MKKGEKCDDEVQNRKSRFFFARAINITWQPCGVYVCYFHHIIWMLFHWISWPNALLALTDKSFCYYCFPSFFFFFSREKKILLIIITIKHSKISTSSTGSFSQSRHIIMKSTKKSIKNFRKCNENVNNIASIWDTFWTLLVDVDRCAFLCNLIIVLYCCMVKRPCVVVVYS